MSSPPEKWETVVNKKKSHVTKSDARKAQQKLLDNTGNSTLDPRNPLEHSATIYDAFSGNQKEAGKKKRPVDNDYERPGQSDPSEAFYANRNGHSKQTSGKAGQGKKKPTKPHQIEIDEMHEKLKKLVAKPLEKIIADAKSQYAAYPLIWLKEVACWLQLHLGGPAETDVALVSYPKGFPCSSLSSGIKASLESLITSVPPNVIELILTHCVTSMFAELQQGKGTMGFRILLHIIAAKRQDILLSKLPEVIANKPVSQKAYLSIMWMYSHCLNNITDGMLVWKSVMFPALHVRSHSPVAVNYLETLINTHKNNKFAKGMLSPDELLEFIRLAFSAKSPLGSLPQLKLQMENLVVQLTRFTLSDKPGNLAVGVFKAFFNFLSDDDKAVKEKVAQILVFCWSNNKDCAAVFEEYFTSNYSSSSVLLGYICKRQSAVSKELSGGGWYSKVDVLKDLGEQLLAVLDEQRKLGEGSKTGFSDCVTYCKQLVGGDSRPPRTQSRTSSAPATSWKFFFFKWTIYLLLITVAVDLYRSNGLQRSATNQVLKKYGLDTHAAKVARQVDSATIVAITWLRKNVPHYYSRVEVYVGPVVDGTVAGCKTACTFIREKSQPAVDYIYATTPVVLAKIDEFIPGFTTAMTNLPMDIQLVYLPKAYDAASDLVSATCTFCQVASVKIRTSFVYAMHEVYKLSPSTFDAFEQNLYLAWDKVIEYSPIICDRVAKLAVQTKDTALHCVHAGRDWLNAHVTSAAT